MQAIDQTWLAFLLGLTGIGATLATVVRIIGAGLGGLR